MTITLETVARSDSARSAFVEGGPAGLLAFRSARSTCTLAEAGLYADLMSHVGAVLDAEGPTEHGTIWDTAEDLAYRGWNRDGKSLYEMSLVLSRLPGI